MEAERKKAPRPGQRSTGERAGSRVPKPSTAGRKVASQKRDDRDRRRKDIARRRMLIAFASVAAVALLMWGLVALWQAPVFTVDTVKVNGVQHLTREQVVALASVPDDATLLKLPKAQIVKRVEESPWVASARLSRSFPHTIVLDITERTPVGIVETGPQGTWLVSGEGYWLAQRSNEPTGTLTLIKGIPSLSPIAGNKSNSPVLSNALAVIAGLSPQLKQQLKFVSAETIEKTMLVLNNDVQVFVGSSDQIAKKDLIARAILGKQKNIVYVNVRVTDRPTWRGLNPGD